MPRRWQPYAIRVRVSSTFFGSIKNSAKTVRDVCNSKHQVLISPQWIVGVSWNDRKVSVSLSRGAVKGSPPYAPGSRVERDEEASIYDHYRRPGYWAREVQLQNPEFRNIPLGSPTTTYRNL
jgi:hypothetical protein